MTPRRTPLAWIALPAALVVAVAAVSSVGGELPLDAGAAVVLQRLAVSGGFAALYLASAVGLGGLLAPIARGAGDHAVIRVVGGIALQLLITQVLAVAGLLFNPVVAWAPIVIGLVMLAAWVRSLARAEANPPWPLLAVVPPVAVLVVAAANPPGVLWRSEFGGFDALSYHLQLPAEWIAGGRIAPLEHNVYSYLPGLIEGAFTHAGVLIGGGFTARAGSAVYAAQFLHAMLALVAAWATARATRTLMDDPEDLASGRWGGLLAACLVLGVPWTVVAGSLAYNEMGVAAMLAGSLAVALDRGISPARKGLLTGLIVGVACGCKATALLFVAPPVAIALAFRTPPTRWHVLALTGLAASLLAVSPWLVRNAIACGNPVFPYLSNLFGPAHWSPDQYATFSRAHHFEGGVADRFRLLLWPDANDPAARPGSPVHRGMMHHQYAFFFPVVALSACALAVRSVHKPAAMLCLGLAAQLAAWLAATHLQSRFLMPMLIPGSMLVALGVMALARATPMGARTWVRVAAFAVPLLMGVQTCRIFAAEGGASPNRALATGVEGFTGEIFLSGASGLSREQADQLIEQLPPAPWIRLRAEKIRPPEAPIVYLLGDAAPLYFPGPVLYHTTYDASPLGRLMREHPDAPAEWTRRLRAAGVGLVLVNPGELERYHRSGAASGGRGWYDPLVTPERVREWLAHARPIKLFPATGHALFALEERP